jgi:hypothetical protein
VEGPERAAVAETDGVANNGVRVDLVTIRRPPWKLIHAPARESWELYDLGSDPGEHAPLPLDTGEGPALQRQLTEFASTAPPAPAHDGRDPALREKLRALGYAN